MSERLLVMRCHQQYVDDRGVGAKFQSDVVSLPDGGPEARKRGFVLPVIGAFPPTQIAHEFLLGRGQIVRLGLQRTQQSRKSGRIGSLDPVGSLQ